MMFKKIVSLICISLVLSLNIMLFVPVKVSAFVRTLPIPDYSSFIAGKSFVIVQILWGDLFLLTFDDPEEVFNMTVHWASDHTYTELSLENYTNMEARQLTPNSEIWGSPGAIPSPHNATFNIGQAEELIKMNIVDHSRYIDTIDVVFDTSWVLNLNDSLSEPSIPYPGIIDIILPVGHNTFDNPFKQQQLNYFTVWVNCTIPYNGNMSDIYVSIDGNDKTDILRNSFRTQSLDTSISGVIDYTFEMTFAVTWEVVTRIQINVKDYLGTTRYDYIYVMAYHNFVDTNADGVDDRSGLSQWTEQGTSDYVPPTATNPTEFGSDFFTSGFDFIKQIFVIFPPEIYTLLLIAITGIIILGVVRLVLH